MKFLAPLLLSMTFFIYGCHAGNNEKINNGMSAHKIISGISKGKTIVVKGKIITGDLDFTKVGKTRVFSSSNQVADVNVPVTFLDCIFMGDIICTKTDGNSSFTVNFSSSVTFEACDFRGNVNFDNTNFCEQVNFTGAIFREKAFFNNISLNGRNNYFTAMVSEKYFSMQESLIAGNVDFFKAQFKDRVSFQSTDFRGIARFSNITVDGRTEFSLCHFRDDALFTYSVFKSDFRMANIRSFGKLDLNSCDFQSSAAMTESMIHGHANFSKSQAGGNFDISKTVFVSVLPDFTEFSFKESGKLIEDGKLKN